MTRQHISHLFTAIGITVLCFHRQTLSRTLTNATTSTEIDTPAVPVLIHPQISSLDKLILKWHLSSNALWYDCAISANPEFVTTLASVDSTVDTSFQVTSLSSRMKYFWRVRAHNIFAASAYGVDSFTTVIEVPSQPSILSPNQLTNAPRQPMFTWRPALNASSYHMCVSTSMSFTLANIVVDTLAVDTAISISDTLQENQTYYWRVCGINLGGEGPYSLAQFTTGTAVLVEPIRIVTPAEFALQQNYPNPFNPYTSISFSIPTRSFVSLKVFDLLGREVTSIVSEELSAGMYKRRWNGIQMPSGVYFYSLQSGSLIIAKKLILLK